MDSTHDMNPKKQTEFMSSNHREAQVPVVLSPSPQLPVSAGCESNCDFCRPHCTMQLSTLFPLPKLNSTRKTKGLTKHDTVMKQILHSGQVLESNSACCGWFRCPELFLKKTCKAGKIYNFVLLMVAGMLLCKLPSGFCQKTH